ncbi:toxin glutamine deamidase domain-containing protein, partial [Nocardia gipuzkoensis]
HYAAHGETYADLYGKAWDRAHGEGEFARPDDIDADTTPGVPKPGSAEHVVPRAASGGRCAELTLRDLLRELGPESGIRLPDRLIGPEGMSRSELMAAAGGGLHEFGDHEALVRRLRQLGDGSRALVVDMYHGPRDAHGVGGHAYLLVNENGRIVVRDPALGFEHSDLSRLGRDVRNVEAIVFEGG